MPAWLVFGFVLMLLNAGVRAELVFSAPPRESEAKAVVVYKPIAEFFGKVLGEKVSYKYSDNWLSYQDEMRKGEYDLVFDGPHFIGWRIAKLGHVPLVKLPGSLTFVVIARSDNPRIAALKDLAGRTVCGFAPPNLAVLTMLQQFDNPVRQPLIVEAQSFADAYRGVLDGRCAGAVLQTRLWEEFEKDKPQTRPLFQSRPIPNQAFTSGPRIAPDQRAKLAAALLAEDGKAATRKLREEFKGQDFVPARAEEYRGLELLLRDVWGFEPR
jgi:ABC-type phosphate/phosphonate transport system substrate-binding protein